MESSEQYIDWIIGDSIFMKGVQDVIVDDGFAKPNGNGSIKQSYS